MWSENGKGIDKITSEKLKIKVIASEPLFTSYRGKLRERGKLVVIPAKAGIYKFSGFPLEFTLAKAGAGTTKNIGFPHPARGGQVVVNF